MRWVTFFLCLASYGQGISINANGMVHARSGGATITLTQANVLTVTNSGNPATITSTTAGGTLACAFFLPAVSLGVSGVTDGGDTFTRVAGGSTTGVGFYEIWYTGTVSTGTTSITVTTTGGGSTFRGVCYEIAGLTSRTADQSLDQDTQGPATSVTGAAVTIASQPQFIIGTAFPANNMTAFAGGGFTNDSLQSGNAYSHRIVTSTGTFTPSGTQDVSGLYGVVTATFK